MTMYGWVFLMLACFGIAALLIAVINWFNRRTARGWAWALLGILFFGGALVADFIPRIQAAAVASVPTPAPQVVEKQVVVKETVEVQVPAVSAVLTDTAWVGKLVTAPASVVWVPCTSEGGLCASWNTFANGNGQPVKMKVLTCPLEGARLVEGKEVAGLPVGEWQVLGITVRPCPVKPVAPTPTPAAKAAVAPVKFDPLSVVTLKDGVKLAWSNCVPPEPDAVCWNTYKNGDGKPVWMKLSCYQDGVRLVDGKEVTGLLAGENPSVLGITVRPCK